jgi:hypothetical protein
VLPEGNARVIGSARARRLNALGARIQPDDAQLRLGVLSCYDKGVDTRAASEVDPEAAVGHWSQGEQPIAMRANVRWQIRYHLGRTSTPGRRTRELGGAPPVIL